MNILILSLMMFLISMMFSYLTSPLSMGLSMIMLALIISMSMMFTMPSSWFSFLLIMVFLSAMMIIFIYVSSLASNEISYTLSFPIMVALITFTLYYMPNLNSYNMNTQTTFSYPYMLMNKIYSMNLSMFTILLMIYLLLALIVTMKNISMVNSPFRSK